MNVRPPDRRIKLCTTARIRCDYQPRADAEEFVMKVGVWLTPQHVDVPSLRRAGRETDALAVDSVWLWDHFFPLTGDPDGKHFEGWSPRFEEGDTMLDEWCRRVGRGPVRDLRRDAARLTRFVGVA
jgi:hypothetical protein